MSVIAKSVIFDIADNWGDASYIGVRSIDFLLSSVVISMPEADFTAYATSWLSTNFYPKYSFDTTLSKIGDMFSKQWVAADTDPVRLIIVFDTPQEFDGIIINNSHAEGTETDFGIKNIKITISADTITDTTYNAAISNSEQIFNDQVAEHISSDAIDNQQLILFVTKIPISPANIVMTAQSGLLDVVSLEPGNITFSADLPDYYNGVLIDLPAANLTCGAEITGYDHEISLAPAEIVMQGISGITETIEIEPANLTFGAYSQILMLPLLPSADITFGASFDSYSQFTKTFADVYYILTLTGDADGEDDIEMPMSSFQTRMRNSEPTFLMVVLPGVEYADEITARSNGTLKIDMAYKQDGEYLQRETIVQANPDIKLKLFRAKRLPC